VNKSLIPCKKKRRGRPGYPLIIVVRLLAYAILSRCLTDKGLIRRSSKKPNVAKALGLKQILHRTTVGRWRKRHAKLMEDVFAGIVDLLVFLLPTEMLIADLSPIKDYNDPEAEIGFYSRGYFIGFKVHVSVNQLGLPLRFKTTTGNKHDCPILPELLVKTNYLLRGADYDSKLNRDLCKAIGAKPLIARNRRRRNKRRWTPKLLKKFRYIVEQFNSLLKGVLQKSWQHFRRLDKKRALIASFVVAINLIALHAIFSDNMQLLRKVSEFWY